jgi:uncharacterized surface protein with fasciclin (FAS1) repeats
MLLLGSKTARETNSMKIRTTIVSLSVIALAVFTPARLQEKDIVDTAVASGSFKTLTKLAASAGLVEAMKGDGPFTVLAPTDAAFAKVPKKILEALGKNKELLAKVLKYHVIAGKIKSSALKAGTVKTFQGEFVTVSLKGGASFNGAKVTKADIMCSNGIIHVIDNVILPPTVAKMVAKIK